MKFLILICCFVLIFHKISGIPQGCSIPSVLRNQPSAVVLRPLGDDYIISDIETIEKILSNGRILLNCESFSYRRVQSNHNYNSYRYQETTPSSIYETEKSTTVQLLCDFGQLSLLTQTEFPKKIDDSTTIECNNELSFYRVQSDTCNDQALVFGLNIKNISVAFAEICYNFNSMKIGFVHYTTGKRSSLLHRQIDHNPNTANISGMINENKFTFDQNYNLTITIENNLTMFKSLVKLIDYELAELVESAHFMNLLKYLTPDNKLPLVPWWKPLKNGNWIIYQQLLQLYTRNQNFSVYTGISHQASYPEKFLCSIDSDMTYKVKTEDKNIPQYIWSYVKMRNETSHPDDVVVIGINTPFFETAQILCTDVCSNVTWLAELEMTRKMQAFGYIFCCDPEDVETVLEGFPKKSAVVKPTLDYLESLIN